MTNTDTEKHQIDVDFFKQLDRFTFMVRKKVSTAYAGSRRSIRGGRGLETIGYRQYYPGDDLKSIDWNVYARLEKYYVRKFEEEKSLTTHILLDTSNSMNYTSNSTTKFEYGAMLAAAFAYLVTKDNDKFAISTFSDKVNIKRTQRGKKYLLNSIDILTREELGGDTDIEQCVAQYEKAIKSRSVIIIISDFLDDPESIKSAIYRLSKHDLILIQVLDKAESQLSFHGNIKLQDVETGTELHTYISENLKSEYQKMLEEHSNSIRSICNRFGADFHTFTTDTPVFDSFFYAISRRR
ncbi:protein of unknown function DUF58 [Methanosalsum zhilinae DSM 4017]|uniref:DUF58 domain-containing protein n=1 Tax=Methanosalsum zhilinae (strain DSM 4017 / NBRC 107636 / OCM 62 / WeN5) TaxID=679901 RepID=F7XQK5_METZD|nr:DUF58 domain-containing protein [Methanosalsum zhilinae]AEH60508.1 protein of unknown function DUF58 [Methanosalsum zhilinae DSM 4017]